MFYVWLLWKFFQLVRFTKKMVSVENVCESSEHCVSAQCEAMHWKSFAGVSIINKFDKILMIQFEIQ